MLLFYPFEAVKVRVQTQPGFARGLSDGLPKYVKSEGVFGLYKGLVPLWGRQIPCKLHFSIDYLFNNFKLYYVLMPSSIKYLCSSVIDAGTTMMLCFEVAISFPIYLQCCKQVCVHDECLGYHCTSYAG
ncbi:hypothetical protein Dimus_013072 [Dionaea muscipula]